MRNKHVHSEGTERHIETEGSIRDAMDAISALHGGKPKPPRRYQVFRPREVCDF